MINVMKYLNFWSCLKNNIQLPFQNNVTWIATFPNMPNIFSKNSMTYDLLQVRHAVMRRHKCVTWIIW